MTGKDQLREDVIDAARAWVKDQCRDWRAYAPGTTSRALCAAIHELDAPIPVKPSEVAPGTRVRYGCGVFRVFLGERGAHRLLCESTWREIHYLSDARVIPIEGEEE